jgi:predicted ATPase
MLKSLTVRGFKSIAQHTLDLDALTVLIGANGSGKTALLSALSFLKASVLGNTDSLVTPTAGALRDVFHDQARPLSCSFAFEEDAFSFEQTLTLTGDRLSATTSTPDALLSAKAAVASWWLHGHPSARATRENAPCAIEDARFFREDASNTAAYLHWLKTEHPATARQITKLVSLAIPYFNDFVLEPLPHDKTQVRLAWTRKGSDLRFDAQALSEGSRHFIELVIALNQPASTRPQLIVIDAPERGLHPFALGLLAPMLKAASSHTTVLIATQSVTLLNHFPLASVVVAEHDGKSSDFRRLQENDYRMWDAFSVGELWEKNVLGGRPKTVAGSRRTPSPH